MHDPRYIGRHGGKLTDAGVTINPMKVVSYTDVMLTVSDCRPNHMSRAF
jgi:hypothetical protein